MVEVGEADAGLDQGGGGCPNLGSDILVNGAVDPDIHIQDVSDDTTHREVVGRIPPQGGP